jgi:hypothetical protein
MVEVDSGAENAPFPEDAVGIVVQDVRPIEHRPRAVAFVYGGEVREQPSLPYGRWKREVRPAA